MMSFYFDWLSFPVVQIVLIIFALLFSVKYNKRQNFAIRVALATLISTGVCFFIEYIFFLLFDDPSGLNHVKTSIWFKIYRQAFPLLMMLLTYLSMTFIFDERRYLNFIACVYGYSLQHVIMHCFLVALKMNSLESPSIILILYGCAYLIGFILTYIYSSHRSIMVYITEKDVFGKVLFYVLALLACSIMTLYSNVLNESTDVITSIYHIIPYVLIIIVILFHRKSNELDKKVQIISSLYEQELAANKAIKYNQELFNIQLHDLKHKINDSQDKERYKNLTNTIAKMNVKSSTGLPILDTIMNHYLLNYDSISLHSTFFIDGSAFDFMEDDDLYSFFGNIISNAFEAADKIDDLSKRSVIISSKQVNNLLFLHEENYCKNKIRLVNGLPATSKKDSSSHGYGMRSLKMIAEKYHGEMKISLEKDIFSIDFIFTLENNKC